MSTILFAAGGPLDNPFFDGTPAWELIVLLIMLGLGVMAFKGTVDGVKDNKPAKLANRVLCVVGVCFLLFLASHVLEISNSPSFNEVGRMGKLTGGVPTTISGPTTTTR